MWYTRQSRNTKANGEGEGPGIRRGWVLEIEPIAYKPYPIPFPGMGWVCRC